MPHITRRQCITAPEPGYLDRGQTVYRVAIGQRPDAQLQPDVPARANALRDAIDHQPIGQHPRYPASAAAVRIA